MIDSSIFPAAPKIAPITSAFKKGSKNSKENYRSVSVWPKKSMKERCMYKQMSNYLGNFFSKFQSRFGQGISAQNCPLAMIEKWIK